MWVLVQFTIVYIGASPSSTSTEYVRPTDVGSRVYRATRKSGLLGRTNKKIVGNLLPGLRLARHARRLFPRTIPARMYNQAREMTRRAASSVRAPTLRARKKSGAPRSVLVRPGGLSGVQPLAADGQLSHTVAFIKNLPPEYSPSNMGRAPLRFPVPRRELESDDGAQYLKQ